MTVYLVDMENIPHAWGRLLDACGEDDRFVLFYTEQVTQVPITLMVKALEARASMEYIKCHSGPNGLDFQLVTEMGCRVARDPSAEYVIVSQDHGYDVVIDYWSERGIQTRRVVPTAVGQGGVISEYGAGGGAVVQSPEFTNERELKEFLGWKLSNRVPKGEIAFIAEALISALAQGDGYSTDRRLSCRFTYLDRALREKYGNVKGPKIRDQIKAVSREVFGLDLKTLDRPEEASGAETAGPEDSPAAEPESAAEKPEPTVTEPKSAEEKPEPAETEPESAEAEPVLKAAGPVELELESTESEPVELNTPAGQSDIPVYPQLLALNLPSGKAEAVSNIVSEVLESGEEHARAAVYRKILSAFGRVHGGELYRAVKEAAGQILSEQKTAD